MKLPVLLSSLLFLLAPLAPASRSSNAAAIYGERQTCQLANSGVLPTDQMIAACKAVLNSGRASPDEAALAHTVLGVQYCMKGQYSVAVAEHTQAIALAPNFPLPYRDRAACFGHLGNLHAQLADLDQAIAIAPDFGAAREDRADLYASLGKEELALADYNVVIAADPTDPAALSGRAHILLRLDRFGEAADGFAALFDADPDVSSRLWLYLARARASRPDPDLRGDLARLHANGWEQPIVKLFAGGLSIDDVKRVLQQLGGTRDDACQIEGFAGEYALLNHDTSDARAMLEDAGLSCPGAPHLQDTAKWDAGRLDPANAKWLQDGFDARLARLKAP